jgi:cell wall-associated NlpC family hydrolase
MSTTIIHKVALQVRRNALAGVQQRGSIHYTQAAHRWYGITNGIIGPDRQPHYADCSAYATWCVWSARKTIRGKVGADTINGEAWRWGYTGTMLEHGALHHHGVDAWYPGRTLIFYGKPSVVHVAIYVGRGMVVSHGSESGPLYLPWNYRPDFNQARAYSV